MPPRIDAEWWARALLFALVFGLLIAPWPDLPRLFRDVVEAVVNTMLAERSWHPVAMLWLRGGEELAAFSGNHGASWTDMWLTTLWIENASTGLRDSLPIDLRALVYLPTATAFALACSVPLGRGGRDLRLSVTAFATTQLVIWVLVATPIAAFLGGASSVRVFEFGAPTLIVLNVVYRALLAPPGMAYAVPGLIWLAFLWIESRAPETDPLTAGH